MAFCSSRLGDVVAAVFAILLVLGVTQGQLTKIALLWPGVTMAPGARTDRH
jgi:hypothetical protein